MIKIDVREHSLISQCNELVSNKSAFGNLKIITEPLPIGDIILCVGDKEQIIIERKTIADLLASIKDGRYQEQSFRLNGCECHNHNIIYLVEGDISRKTDAEKTILYSSLFSINHYKGFSIIRSANITETAFIICGMMNKLIKSNKDGRTPFYLNATDNENNTGNTYSSVVKKVKKENINSKNIGEIMLAQIPGISSVSSGAIFNEFNTLPNLIEELKNNKQCLDSVYSIDKNGNKRKLGKNVIKILFEYLVDRVEQEPTNKNNTTIGEMSG